MNEKVTYPSLENKVVVITGGASGIGENIVEHFIMQKSKVAFLDIEEKLGNELVKKLEKKYNLKKKIVGVLGLTFKSETDDIRDSLSIKLLQLLKSKKIKTLQSDEYFKSKENVSKKYLVKKSDIIIVSTPHKAYKYLKISKNKILVDIWGLIEKK